MIIMDVIGSLLVLVVLKSVCDISNKKTLAQIWVRLSRFGGEIVSHVEVGLS